MSIILTYDGSFAGWLSAVFYAYECKVKDIQIAKAGTAQGDAFAQVIEIMTESAKARRVWNGLLKKLSITAADRIYYCFLSELPEVEDMLLRFVQHVFANTESVEDDFSNPDVLAVTQLARKVWREKHRMEAFVRFQQLRDDMYYSAVEPDHNVLPLIAKHFNSRYADQHWLIYDIRRKYGIQYQPSQGFVTEVTFDWEDVKSAAQPQASVLSEREELYQLLWKDYFKNTGIPARKNLQLHIRHIPKRYWKHLTEKAL